MRTLLDVFAIGLALAAAPAAWAQLRQPTIPVPRLQTCNGVTTMSNAPAGSSQPSSVPAEPCPGELPQPQPPPQPTAPEANPSPQQENNAGGIILQPTNPNPTVGGVPTQPQP